MLLRTLVKIILAYVKVIGPAGLLIISGYQGREALEVYSEALQNKGCPLQNCVGRKHVSFIMNQDQLLFYKMLILYFKIDSYERVN